MPEVPGPGDSGFSPGRWLAHQIFSGLRLAREFGFGVPLGNALRSIFSDEDSGTIWGITRTVGQGVRAAQAFQSGDGVTELDLAGVPVVPAEMSSGGESNRIVALADVTWHDNTTDTDKTWSVHTDCPEGMTFDELEQCIRDHIAANLERYNADALEAIVNALINLYFLGKRF